jgi:hypothetical protein
LTPLDVDRLIVVWMSPIRLGDHEQDHHGDVVQVIAPSSEVEGLGVLAPPSHLLQVVDGAALCKVQIG